MDLKEQIKQMLVDSLGIPAEDLDYDSELFGEDIGLDSIDSIEIIAGIDNLYGIDMTGEAKEHFASINAIADYVEAHKE